MTTEMTCKEARASLLDAQREQAPAPVALAVRAHLETCPACRNIDEQERVLSELLRSRLTHPRAPSALKDRLTRQVAASTVSSTVMPIRARMPVRAWQLSAAVAALAACLVLGRLLPFPAGGDSRDRVVDEMVGEMVGEAVNDHLRVLYATQPVEIESGGIHQVKPWFSGRIDFAPDVAFSGDADFPLVGGAVGYFIDRKAATMIWKRRLHTISLFIFRDDGLPWPTGPESVKVGSQSVQVRRSHGFNLLLWHAGGLGHALISDVSRAELIRLCGRLDRE